MDNGSVLTNPKPLVSICMGVYNAQKFIDQTLDSILTQDYPHFELLISDNGSQDQSEEICRRYARKDSRIIYSRHETNINPLENSTGLLDQASGDFHLWASDHDVYHPQFISQLIEQFEGKDDSIVLCYPDTLRIDSNNKSLGIIEEDIDTQGLSPAERFKKVMWGLSFCTPIYGLYRMAALKEVWKVRYITGPDRVFLPELSLKGHIVHHKKVLFSMRQNRSVENYADGQKRQIKWFVPNEYEALVPVIMRDYELLKIVQNSELKETEKKDLLGEIIRWHHADPEGLSIKESEKLIQHGIKNLNAIDISLKDKKSAAEEYLRISKICVILRPYLKDRVDKLVEACNKIVGTDGIPGAASSESKIQGHSDNDHRMHSSKQAIDPTNEEPKVSIAMGVYNAEQYLSQTLDSILKQDYSNFELIISDNGSQDRSGDICLEYAKKDNRIIYSRNETNINPLQNSTSMLERSTGEFHLWASDHDIYHPQFISSLMDEYRNADDSVVLVYSDACHIDHHNKPIREISEDVDTRGLAALERFKKVMWGLSYCTPIFGLYRSSALKEVWKMRWIICPDWVFMPEFSLKGTFVNCKKTLFFWRQNRPVENHYELNKRQANWFVENPVEKLALVTMRDYELLLVVQNTDLKESEKEELFFEILRRHHCEPHNPSLREARHLLYEGRKLLAADTQNVGKKIDTLKDYLRVAGISKLLCKEKEEELEQFCDQCTEFIMNEMGPLARGNSKDRQEGSIESESSLEQLIPPEIHNDEFYDDIKKLTAQKSVGNILEIGSSSGQGSTKAFVEGIKATGRDTKLFCMEISKTRFDRLEEAFQRHPNVRCYRASSVSLKHFPMEQEVTDFYRNTPTALNQYPLDQVVGWLAADKKYLGQSEVCDHGIQKIKHENRIQHFDMVLIDGSEFTGKAELDQVHGAGVIMLDDINGYKNHHNYHRLKRDPEYVLEKENWNLRNGYAIFRKVADIRVPIHFFTIVLNGAPFIQYHYDLFRKLDIPWHWHIIEGVADHKHDTAWSLQNGGHIPESFHRNGLSIDDTSTYLDRIAADDLQHISIYRKEGGAFWDGKLEMVNAPLRNLPEHCLLWQIDADELWRKEQIEKAHLMFADEPDRSAAYFHCHFFVGPNMVTTTRDTYSHNTQYEWLRLWRFRKGMKWKSHEPPCLMEQQDGKWVPVHERRPFLHNETENAGLVFSHHAYSVESQLRFKEAYYGYRNAVDQWRNLQKVQELPARLADYFGWVNDDTLVDRVDHRTIGGKAPYVPLSDIIPDKADTVLVPNKRIVIDGVIFQLQAGHAQGISRVWSNLVPRLVRMMPDAEVILLQREGYPVTIDGVMTHDVPIFELGDAQALDRDDEMLRIACSSLKADIFISTYYTRAPGAFNLMMVHDLIPELMGYDLSQPEWLAKQRTIETADGFISVSKTSLDDLVAHYPQVAQRPMQVIQNGLDDHFKDAHADDVDKFLNKLQLKQPYVLLVGNRGGYKNGDSFLEAVANLPEDERPTVLCVGGEAQLSSTEKRLQEKLDIRFAGRLTDRDLAVAYGGAQALCLPSKYEGFGLPVLEAMACGCPVIASYSPAVLEVGADAVYLADITSTDGLQKALQKINSEEHRNNFKEKGLQRAAQFNWNETAGSAADFVRQCLENQSIILTAIVSTYNAEAFIQGCLEDLVRQTIGDQLEVIVVDSASQEDEAAIVRDFQVRCGNIKYIRTPAREKVYQAWNRGIKFALGKYVTNANTDDRHRRDAYEIMVSELESNDEISLVYADVIKTETANETFRNCTPTGMHHWYDWDRSTLLEKGCFIGPQPVWRKDVHESYGYFDEAYEVSGDFEFWLRISQTNEFYHISKPLGVYMDRPDSVEHANAEKKRIEDQAILDRYRQAARQNVILGLEFEGRHPERPSIQQDHKFRVQDRTEEVPDNESNNTATLQGGLDMHSTKTLIKAAGHLIDGGYKDAALWVLTKMVADFPTDARLHSELAALAYDQADTETALAHFKKATELEPQNTDYMKALADYYYVVEKDSGRALDQYERILDVDPDHVDALIMAGHVAVSLHQYSKGQSYYQKALELDPQNQMIAEILGKMNNTALEQTAGTLSVDELYAAAVAKSQDNDDVSAIAMLEQLLTLDDTHALAHNDLAVLQYDSGNMEDALSHYKRASELQPENELFQKNLADFQLVVMGDAENAMRAYIQVLKLNPLDVEALLSCAQICICADKESDARDFIMTALESEPWNENAKSLLQQLDRGVTSSGPESTDLYERAKSKASQGDLTGAIDDLRQYVAAFPNDANAYNDLGVLHFEAGDKDKALAAYQRAVQLEPNDSTYLKNLADFYLIEKGNAKDAMRLYLKVLEENSQDIEALIASGIVCKSVGQVEDAKHFYHRALEIEPWNETARKALEEIHASQGAASGNGLNTAAAG